MYIRISDCCNILHIKQDNIIVELIDFQITSKEQDIVINQLKNLLKRDKIAYENCNLLTDYIAYVDEWYDGLYVPMAKEKIKELKRAESNSAYDKPSENKRPVIVTLLIYVLLLGSALSFFIFLKGVFWSIGLLYDSDWSIINAYGKGFIPGCLISLTVVIGNILILRKKSNGFWFMSLMGLILVIPTIFNDYEEVLYFSIPLGFSLFLYYMILHVKQNGYSAWNMMKGGTILKKITLYFWALYLILVLLTPPVLSISFGFRKNYFDNGMMIFGARWGSDKSYYSNKLANKLSSGSDGINNVSSYEIKKWHGRAIMYSKDYEEDFFFEYADYLISIDDYINAYRVLKNANVKYHNGETAEKLNHFMEKYGSF